MSGYLVTCHGRTGIGAPSRRARLGVVPGVDGRADLLLPQLKRTAATVDGLLLKRRQKRCVREQKCDCERCYERLQPEHWYSASARAASGVTRSRGCYGVQLVRLFSPTAGLSLETPQLSPPT